MPGGRRRPIGRRSRRRVRPLHHASCSPGRAVATPNGSSRSIRSRARSCSSSHDAAPRARADRRAERRARFPTFELTDAVIIDGDHNYFTVSEELRLIAERAGDGPMPLILLHDIGWPLARRDSYHDSGATSGRAPPAARRARLSSIPGDPALGRPRPLLPHAPRRTRAARETASSRRSRTSSPTATSCASRIMPPFFGLGVIWDRAAPAADAIAAAIAPWDRNPLLDPRRGKAGRAPRRRVPPHAGDRRDAKPGLRASAPARRRCSSRARSRWPSGSRAAPGRQADVHPRAGRGGARPEPRGQRPAR